MITFVLNSLNYAPIKLYLLMLWGYNCFGYVFVLFWDVDYFWLPNSLILILD